MVSKEKLLQCYKDMALIRRFEEKAAQLYGMGLIGGFCHLYIGQEAVVVGFQAMMEPQDTVITSYRDHGHMLACGMDPKGVMAELTGRIGGYSKGKGGSMHMFSREKNFFGGHGIVGAPAAIGTGMAFSHQYKKDHGVCLSYFGDGAADQGQVFESFNMASLWALPIIYIIEDNGYSMGTSLSRHAADTNLSKRGESFGMLCEVVDGMDIFKVMESAQKALSYTRSGQGPVLLQVKTYRYRGHSMSDPGKYRDKEEVDSMKQNHDPIERLKKYLEESGVSEEQIKSLDKTVKNEVDEAVEFSKSSPLPDVNELYTDILLPN